MLFYDKNTWNLWCIFIGSWNVVGHFIKACLPLLIILLYTFSTLYVNIHSVILPAYLVIFFVFRHQVLRTENLRFYVSMRVLHTKILPSKSLTGNGNIPTNAASVVSFITIYFNYGSISNDIGIEDKFYVYF